jgi:uncharacterized peroxidase-related enzyme
VLLATPTTLEPGPAADHFPARELSGIAAAGRLAAMTTFTVHTAESAPEASRPALAALEQNIGFIPHLAATIAGSPVALGSFVAVQTALRGTTLTALERETVAITVSRVATCPYSMAAHSTFAANAGGSPETLAALRDGTEVPDARLEALRQFADELARTRGHVPAAEVGRFLAAGFTAEQALEAATQAAYTTLANLIANLADTPVDAAFAARAWEPALA